MACVLPKRVRKYEGEVIDETSRSISMSIRTVIPRGINRIASCNLKYQRKAVTWDSNVDMASQQDSKDLLGTFSASL